MAEQQEAIETLTVSILDREFRVNCPPSEQQHLIDSAAELDKRMREIKNTGRVIGVDRIAIMAALNITSELLSNTGSSDQVVDSVNQKIETMADKIERALHETEELNF
jgi:cell division protein ZapA